MAAFAPREAKPLGRAPRADEAAFLTRHRCQIVSVLEAIHATPAETDEDQNRFLIVYRPEAANSYVQCVLVDWDRRIFCEASSGFFDHDSSQPREHLVSGDRLQALARLGFSLDDSDGNYVRRFPVAGPADFPAVADFILSALYEGYGLAADARIGVEAPDADRKAIEGRCAPIS